MGKRSNFERIEKDLYITPEVGVLPLLPHLNKGTHFVEFCGGTGALIDHLEKYGHKCVKAYDIDPKDDRVEYGDATKMVYNNFMPFMGITNPPWSRNILHPILERIIESRTPCWLLFDADWMHTKQSSEYMKHCHKVVSIGRLKWIPGSPSVGKDNCAWYLFKRAKATTEFYGR